MMQIVDDFDRDEKKQKTRNLNSRDPSIFTQSTREKHSNMRGKDPSLKLRSIKTSITKGLSKKAGKQAVFVNWKKAIQFF